MAFVNHFYNSTTRKYVTLFGTLFNKIRIKRIDESNGDEQSLIVPIHYGPWQKFLSRITQDPQFTQKSAITLPRMSFEITGMNYDGERKVPSLQKLRKNAKQEESGSRSYMWSASPYSVEFSLYIMTKYSEDAVKIVEQIIPFFKPEWTTTVKLIDDIDPLDIPLVLNNVTNEELYEGSYEERKSVLWTLNFTMKCWYFGPERQKKIIKFVETHMYDNLDSDSTTNEVVNVYPGLTANGQPTTDPGETISYQDIEFDDDWSVITVIEEDIE